MATPVQRETVITLPDYYNDTEVAEFVDLLGTQLTRFGVKKLRHVSQVVFNHLKRIEQHVEEAQRLILVVNGTPTHAQMMGFTERKLRTAAFKFYESCSDALLDHQLEVYGLDKVAYTNREAVVNALVKKHVELETGNTWSETGE